jgi:hypothetical protein
MNTDEIGGICGILLAGINPYKRVTRGQVPLG